jgi:hypothetical protein
MSGFINDTNPSQLGGGVRGVQPRLLGGGANGSRGSSSGMEGGSQRAMNRVILRQVLNHKVFPNGDPHRITPFRRYLNAGDTAGTLNSNPSALLGRPPNQVKGNSMVSRLHANHGGTNNTGDAFFSGNQKFVYDSSDYVKFKKLFATNKTYNDLTFGGAGGSSVSQALRRVRG